MTVAQAKAVILKGLHVTSCVELDDLIAAVRAEQSRECTAHVRHLTATLQELYDNADLNCTSGAGMRASERAFARARKLLDETEEAALAAKGTK